MQTTDTQPTGLVAGIDDSDHAVTVARVADRLASQLGLNLTLVHVAHHEKTYLVGDKRLRIVERGSQLLRRVADQADLRERVSLRLELGDTATELLDTANQLGAQAVVVGSRGRGQLRSGLLGSVSQRLATRATCPVVVVPPAVTADWHGIETMLAGIDDTEGSDAAAAWAGALSRRLAARLVMVHVVQAPVLLSGAEGLDLVGGEYPAMLEAERQSAFALLHRAASQAEFPPRAEFMFEVGDPAAQLDIVAGHQRADLIIVGARARGGLHAAVLGGLARRLVAHAACPVVVVPVTAAEPTVTPTTSANGRPRALAAAAGPNRALAVENARLTSLRPAGSAATATDQSTRWTRALAASMAGIALVLVLAFLAALASG
jgi:nucleotide-binding universal stress UspA family protein